MKTPHTDRLVGKKLDSGRCWVPGAESPKVARASQATDGAVGNIFHGHKYHPLGPLKVKIISSLMWIPLWRKLPGTGAASQAPSARPARVPPPRLMRAPPRPAEPALGPWLWKPGHVSAQLHKGSDLGHYRLRRGGKKKSISITIR